MSSKSDNPPYFPVGTVVSARYRGAYCSAVVKRVLRMIEAKVVFDRPDLGSLVLPEDFVKGSMVPGKPCEAKHPENGVLYKATLLQVMDKSVYTVVYDDGDINNLRRSKLCAPGARHFPENESLDRFPLLSPEEFSTPVQVPVAHNSRRQGGAATTPKGQAVTTSPDCKELVPVPDQDECPSPPPPAAGNSKNAAPPKGACKAVKKKSPKRRSGGKRKKKRKQKTARAPAKKVPEATTVAVIELEDDPPEPRPQDVLVSNNAKTVPYTYFYVTPCESQVVVVNKSSCQKRKAFVPKKVIRILSSQCPVMPTTQAEATITEVIVPDAPEDGPCTAVASCHEEEEVAATVNVMKEEPIADASGDSPPTNRSASPLLVVKMEEEPLVQEDDDESDDIDYAHKKLRLGGDFEDADSAPEPAEVDLSYLKTEADSCSSPSSSTPVDLLFKQLSDIVDEKKVEVPESPPQGKNFNFVPNLEHVKDTDVREVVIRESLKSVVIEYFLTKEKLEKLNKRKRKKSDTTK